MLPIALYTGSRAVSPLPGNAADGRGTQPIAALAGPLEMFLTSTVDGSGARACVRARPRRGLPGSPRLATALLGLGRVSQLFKVHIERASVESWASNVFGQLFGDLIADKKLAFLLHFSPLKSKSKKQKEGVCLCVWNVTNSRPKSCKEVTSE